MQPKTENSIAIYYLYNSGFVIELGGDVLILDYYRNRFNTEWSIPLPEHPASYDSVTVFVSHSHRDHYNPKIFSWQNERSDIAYVLSEDIKGASEKRKNTDYVSASINYMAEGDMRSVNGHTIKAFGSTDEGISFYIQSRGVYIFHSGDLNDWHWSDESSTAEISEAKERFRQELMKIKNAVQRVDIACFPVDQRMGTDYYRGAVSFCETIKPTYFIPMHFQDNYNLPKAFQDEIAPFTRLIPIRHELDRIEFIQHEPDRVELKV